MLDAQKNAYLHINGPQITGGKKLDTFTKLLCFTPLVPWGIALIKK